MDSRLFPVGAALVTFASVATALRFGHLPVGIGELAVVLLLGYAVARKGALRYLRHPIMLFWIGFLAIAGLAFAINPVRGAGAVHTGAAYVYAAAFSVMALAILDQAAPEDFRSVIRALAIVPVVLLAIPFLCFMFDLDGLAEALGINLDFPSRISAWSTNPNQLALLLLPIPFWLLAVYQDTDWRSNWKRFGLFLWVFFFLGLCVRSDALLLAWIVGLPILTGLAALWLPRPNWRMFATTVTAVILAFASFKLVIDGPGRQAMIYMEGKVSYGIAVIMGNGDTWKPGKSAIPSKSDSGLGVGFDQNKGGARRVLWAHAIESWKEAPIIGKGPGGFSWYDDPKVALEAHNLLFDMLTQVGIAGVLLFSGLYLWLMAGAYRARDPYSFMVLMALMLFSGAHFMLRQPVFSLYMIVSAIAAQHRLFGARKSVL